MVFKARRVTLNLSILVVLGVASMTYAQTAPATAAAPVGLTLPISVALVLTPAFCTDTITQGSYWTTGKDTFYVGKAFCRDAEAELKSSFAKLVVVQDAGAVGDAQVILVPSIGNVGKTLKHGFITTSDIAVTIEWTAKDSAGKTLWIDTVQGHATTAHNQGFWESMPHVMNRVFGEAMKQMFDKSVAAMTAAPELRKIGT